MHRSNLLDSLNLFKTTWGGQKSPLSGRLKDRDLEMFKKFYSFVQEAPHCFERSNLPGHITGSALVVNHNLTKVLLTHHRKLDIWLQLGGHADGNTHCETVAMTEAIEESGLTELSFLDYEQKLFSELPINTRVPFDLDSHAIPKNTRDPAHWHFDVRYLIVGNDKEKPVVSEESNDVRWFTLQEARIKTQEDSMERQFQKVEVLRKMLF